MRHLGIVIAVLLLSAAPAAANTSDVQTRKLGYILMSASP